MKRILLGILLFTLLSAETCNTTNTVVHNDGTPLLESKWVLQSLGGTTVTMPDGMPAPWMKLVKVGSAVEGNGGCNALMGSFALEGNKLTFPGGVGSTKMYCKPVMATETDFLGALKRVDQYELEGGVLKLLGAGTVLATLKSE